MAQGAKQRVKGYGREARGYKVNVSVKAVEGTALQTLREIRGGIKYALLAT